MKNLGIGSFYLCYPGRGVQRSLNPVQPVLGQLQSTAYKPTWWPTANTRREYPSLPRNVSSGQPGHLIGIYRLLDEDIERLVRNINHSRKNGKAEVQIAFGFFINTY